MPYWQQLAIAGPLVFIAGFIDSIAGGGGLITLPAYLMVGLPPHTAMGTSKMSACFGTTASSYQFLRNRLVNLSIVPVTVAGALVGSFIGAKCVLFLDERIIQWIIMVLIPVIAVMMVVRKDVLQLREDGPTGGRMQVLAGLCALLIGWYDGFFGPGTGTFLMLALTGIVGLDIVISCGNTKVINLASNLAALVAFILGGQVYFVLAIPCGLLSMAGNYLGARLAMKKGVKAIKPIMLVVVGLLLVKVGSDLFQATLG